MNEENERIPHQSQIPSSDNDSVQTDTVESVANNSVSQASQMPEQSLRYSSRDVELIRALVKSRLEQDEELEFEEIDSYEVPPRTQFPMLKKPSVTIWYGRLKFNMAAIRLFEGVQFIIPLVSRKKKRIAVLMCKEEESASIEWARQKDEKWVNKDISSPEYTKSIFELMAWNKECRYNALGRVKNSDQGLILVFDLIEAPMIDSKAKEYVDPVTGEIKKRYQKYYPDYYAGRIGRYYKDYAAARQMDMFEHISEYQPE